MSIHLLQCEMGCRGISVSLCHPWAAPVPVQIPPQAFLLSKYAKCLIAETANEETNVCFTLRSRFAPL